MLSYGKQHKRLRGLSLLVYTYFHSYGAFFSYKSYIFQRKERNEIFPANLTFDSRHIIKVFRFLM